MNTLTITTEIENAIIQELSSYKRICGRIKVLERQPVGMGYQVSRMGEDKLQELHSKLKGLPTHMYLSPREQELETTAHAYLETYPVGIRAQHNEVRRQRGVDKEDRDNLKDLSKRVQRVREARSMTRDSYAEVDEKEAELQNLVDERERLTMILEAVGDVRPEYSALLVGRYVDGKSVDDVAAALGIVRKTFDRWRHKAVEEYAAISGMSQTCRINVV